MTGESTGSQGARSDDLVGEIVAGKYRVTGRLAKGGMARIYKAVQEPIGRVVALKLLMTPRDWEEADPNFEARFLREASTLGKLKHGNTVTVFDYGFHEPASAHYMVMEFVDGQTLQEVIREGAVTPLRTMTLALGIIRSLQEAHSFNVVHRDLKASNVMLVDTDEGEQIKVLDFGIAKVLKEDDSEPTESITLDDRIVGSPRYMAPEQVRSGPVDPRTDLYALGVLMFEMLTGRPPFRGNGTMGTLMMHLNNRPPDVSEASPHALHPDLAALVMQCLEKDPDKRPASAKEVRGRLKTLIAEVSGSGTDPSQASTDTVVRHAAVALMDAEASELSTSPTINQPQLPKASSSASRHILKLVALGVVLFGVATTLALAVFLGVQLMTRTGATPTPTIAETLPDAPVVTVPAPPAPEPPRLEITSSPPGAAVWESGAKVGTTPFDAPLGLEAGDPPRTFELRLDGHEPQKLTATPSQADVHLEATLPKRKTRPKKRNDLDDILIER